MIDTAQITNRSTKRSTAGEGHVVRHGDVRRVRKVHVDCSASRPLRGQSPVHNSSRYVHRTETVRNRLIRKPTTKPLPQPVAEAQTQEPRNRQGKEGLKPPIKRAKHVIPAKAGIQRKANLAAWSAKGASPSPPKRPSTAGEGRGEGEGKGGARQILPTQHPKQPKPIIQIIPHHGHHSSQRDKLRTARNYVAETSAIHTRS